MAEARRTQLVEVLNTASVAGDPALKLEALGQGGKEMVIEENTRFSLPAGQNKKPYLLKSVTPKEIEVEYVDESGQKVTETIDLGALPKI